MGEEIRGDFVYEALVRELEQRENQIDRDKYNVILDYLWDVAYDLGVMTSDTPALIVDNIVVNGDFAYEGEKRYEECLESWDYVKEWEGILYLG